MAQAQQMGQLLTVAAGADMNARQQAQSVLETAETTQTVEYINALVALMINPQVEEGLRNLAGLQIKNALTGTSSKIAADKKQALMMCFHPRCTDEVRLTMQVAHFLKDISNLST